MLNSGLLAKTRVPDGQLDGGITVAGDVPVAELEVAEGDVAVQIFVVYLDPSSLREKLGNSARR